MGQVGEKNRCVVCPPFSNGSAGIFTNKKGIATEIIAKLSVGVWCIPHRQYMHNLCVCQATPYLPQCLYEKAGHSTAGTDEDSFPGSQIF